MRNKFYDDVNGFSLAMNDIENIPLLTAEEEYDLGLRILKGDIIARNKLVWHNLKWAANLAVASSKGFSLDVNDLYEEACLALIKSAEKFDCRRGGRFTTFSRYDILSAITKYRNEQYSDYSVSEHDLETIAALRKIQYDFYNSYGEYPTYYELASIYNSSHKKQIDEDTVNRLLLSCQGESMDAEVVCDGKVITNHDIVPSGFAATYENVERAKEREFCLSAINSLEPCKSEVVKLYCGFEGNNMNHREIGKKLGISDEKSRKLFKSACKQLRASEYADRLREYYEAGYQYDRYAA